MKQVSVSFIWIAFLSFVLLSPLRGQQEEQSKEEKPRIGLLRNEKRAFQGYTLFSPTRSTTTYLLNMEGKVVHTWESKYLPGLSVYLLENGNMLRCAHDQENRAFFGAGGAGGIIEEFDWEGNLVWEFVYSNETHMQHHDIEPLPNGNVLLIAREKKSEKEALAAGRMSKVVGEGGMWVDHIVEVKPKRPKGAEVVWEWHVWDHLIQDQDPKKANYGKVTDHPERININGGMIFGREVSKSDEEKLEALGYISRQTPKWGPLNMPIDWNHTNSISYNAKLDQILLSVNFFNEIWIIDHGTTTEEARSHEGGKSGKGGGILYRWGNPSAYGLGTREDQKFFAQHDAQWICKGSYKEVGVLVFNNGWNRKDGSYSSVDEILLPMDEMGLYTRAAAKPFGPEKQTWIFTAPEKTTFFSGFISGAQRLPNGNTLICSGMQARFFEVTREGETVWEYVNPFEGKAPPWGWGPPGFMPPGFPPGRGSKGQGEGAGEKGEESNPPGERQTGRPPNGGGGMFDPAVMSILSRGVFRVTRIPPDYEGLAAKDLKGK